MSEGVPNLQVMWEMPPPSIPDEGVPIPHLPDDVADALSDLELVADIWAADAREARHVAERAASIAALARRRRIERDRDFGASVVPGSTRASGNHRRCPMCPRRS